MSHSRLDGTGNNPAHPTWGTTSELLEFISMGPGYGDHVSTPAGASRPSPRLISNVLFTSQFKWNTVQDVSSWFPFYGQWLAHDMILQAGPGPDFPIKVPRCDVPFDVNCTNTQWIPFQRHLGSVTAKGYLQGANDATSWLDMSTVYSNVPTRMAALRTHSGGLLKTSVGPNGQLLPYNTDGFPNAGGDSRKDLFIAGDPRCNINLGLLALHTLFHLEHNRKAKALALLHPDWTDETLFHEARKYTIGVHQKIAFSEYLPKLLGRGLPPYVGYDPTASPAIDVAFMSAAFRYGHSGTDDLVYRFEESRIPFAEGHLLVADTILNPSEFRRNGLDMVLRGLVMQPEADVGVRMVPGMRTHALLYDMAAIDIQRGRDRGVTDYNTARVAMGFPRVTSFSQITNDTAILSALTMLYTNMSDIDLYVGGLVEAHTTGAVVGPLFASIISAQFARSRNADPFYYLRPGMFSPGELSEIQSRSLSAMILDHTNVKWMPSDVFSLDSVRKTSPVSVVSSKLKSRISPLPGYTMSWSIDTIAQVWRVSITSQKGGWVGVGFGSQMAGSDMIVAYIQNGVPTAVDSIVLGKFQTTPTSDVNNGHSNDVIEGSVAGEIVNGVLTISFSRKLSTGDPSDQVIVSAMMPMLFAHGSTSMPAQHGLFGRALATVNLYTDVAVFDSTDINHLDTAVSVTFHVIAITMAIMQALVILAVVKARNVRAVYFAGPLLIITSLVGCILFSAQLFLLAIKQTETICTIKTFLPSLAFSIVYSINSGKLHRLYRIFTNGGRVVKITNGHILRVTAALALLDLVLSAIWVIGSPLVIQAETPNTCPISMTGTIIGSIRIVVSLLVGGYGVWAFLQLQYVEGNTFAMFRRETVLCGRTAIISLVFFAVITIIELVTAASVFQKTSILIKCVQMAFFCSVPFGLAITSRLKSNRIAAESTSKLKVRSTGMGKYTTDKPSESTIGEQSRKTAQGTAGQQQPRLSMADTDLATLAKELQTKQDESAKMVIELKVMENMMRKAAERMNLLAEATLRLEGEVDYRKQMGQK